MPTRALGLAFVGFAVLLGLTVARAPALAAALALLPALLAIAVPLSGASAVVAAALVANVLVPAKYLPFPGEPASISPAFAFVGLGLIGLAGRRFRPRRAAYREPVVVIGASLAVWIVANALRAGSPKSIGWSFSFVVLGIAVPVCCRRVEGVADRVKIAWVASATVLSAYAVVETYLWAANPIYGAIYRHAKFPLLQDWSTYRATTSLGHPLMNALFFSIGASLAFATWREGRDRRLLAVTIVCSLGTLATQSRTGVAALAAGMLVSFVLPTEGVKRRRLGIRSLFAFSVAMAVISLGVQLVASRSDSSEGTRSAAVRQESVTQGLGLIRDYAMLGAGPGLADDVKRGRTGLGSSGIENSWLQAGVSLGLPGLGLLLAFIAVAVGAGVRARRTEWAAAAAAYFVAASGFNVLEANHPAHIFFGVVLLGALAPTRVRSFTEGPELAKIVGEDVR